MGTNESHLSTRILPTETYHMIDSCDASIAAWSEDGSTFVVKDPDIFAKVRIYVSVENFL